MLRDSCAGYLNMTCACRCITLSDFGHFFMLKSKVSIIPAKISVKVNEKERINADTNTGIANMFNEYFASIFNDESGSISDHRDQALPHSDTVIEDITLSEEEIVAVINLDDNKAQGPDNISVHLLKETAADTAPSFCVLFNMSLRVGAFHTERKLVTVIPVHKLGKKFHTESYRPISLSINS